MRKSWNRVGSAEISWKEKHGNAPLSRMWPDGIPNENRQESRKGVYGQNETDYSKNEWTEYRGGYKLEFWVKWIGCAQDSPSILWHCVMRGKEVGTGATEGSFTWCTSGSRNRQYSSSQLLSRKRDCYSACVFRSGFWTPGNSRLDLMVRI